MRWKIFTVLAVVVILLSAMTPIKVKAQSMVHFALVLPLIVTGIGNNETAEVRFALANNPQNPQPSEDPLLGFNFMLELSSVNDSSCRQTFEKAVLEANLFGLPMLSISKGFDQGAFVTINDGTTVEKHHLLPCFNDGRDGHVAVLLAVPVPRSLADQLAANPDTVPLGVRMPEAAWLSIVDSAGGTVATSNIRFLKSRTGHLLIPIGE